MTDQKIFYEVLTISNPAPEPFAVIRVDTAKRVGNGCEGTVESLHMTRAEAVEVASRLSQWVSNVAN